MKNRVVYLNEKINKDTAQKLVQQLRYLYVQDTSSPITLFINSPGGAVSDGMYIYDMMKACKSEIITMAADMERDYWMDEKQAVAYGIVDHIGYPGELA